MKIKMSLSSPRRSFEEGELTLSERFTPLPVNQILNWFLQPRLEDELNQCYLFAFSVEKENEPEAVIAGFWRRYHSEISFLHFEVYHAYFF